MKMLDHCLDRQAIREEMRVQASGMGNIRQLYPNRARMIGHAHRQAVDYLNEGLRNLDRLFTGNRLDDKRRRYLESFLDIPQVTQNTVRKLKFRLGLMLGELLKPSLAPSNSSRYVVGTGRRPDHSNQAFTLQGRHDGNIYLTERFFEPHLDAYLPIRPRTFDAYGHHMATVLLHEISHITLDTLDFAYLNPSHPFIDLIDTSTLEGRRRHEVLDELQNHAFSTTTPANELFKLVDEYDYRWYDVEGDLKRRVLSLSGARDLDDARQIFLSAPDKRTDILLSNADSLSLLITHLGRPVEFQPFD
ncbi:hypothetical protein [Pseudomonas vanderleydeniana]|uniref:Uncharacterized protein n=1 Tax=Pseudomonas vanderleydeniana TaxID=2745495 RepID=A0A9E6PGL9_9PSED|nr:hypothetical protein [Pseudomonas vanderleydeniana]QXI25870.1 hypothetical protein HU752_018030 [Pseudomonas vanderleydeniana]